MGNTCKSMADSCQCMTKTTTIVISLQLIKINEKKKYRVAYLTAAKRGDLKGSHQKKKTHNFVTMYGDKC